MKCPDCSSYQFNRTKNEKGNGFLRTTITIKSDTLRAILKEGFLDRELESNEFTIRYGNSKPTRPWINHPAAIYVPMLLIALWGFGQSILLGIFLLILGIVASDKAMKKDNFELNSKVDKHRSYLKEFNPTPPSAPTNKKWQYWGWFAFGVFFPFTFKNDEFFGYLMQVVSVLGFPLLWPWFKKRYDLTYETELRVYKHVFDSWNKFVICTSCGYIYLANYQGDLTLAE